MSTMRRMSVMALNMTKEKEVKSKNDEIQDLQDKFDKEREENQKLQKRVEEVTASQSDTGRKLSRALDNSEKLRNEIKTKQELVEKLERNISHMEDRMRNLEIRASEVEKAELTLESTKRNLEASQQDVRMRDRELQRAQEKYDSVCKELGSTKTKVSEMESKIEDLKVQVRHELTKNENIERGLETIPGLKEEISDKDKKMSSLEKDLVERGVLLSASRKTAGEYKEKLRDIERGDKETAYLKDELEVSKSEVETLKMLMSGKDSIVMQRCQQLDQAKMAVDSLRKSAGNEEEKIRLGRIQHVLDQLKQLHMLAPADRIPDSHLPHNRYTQSGPHSATADHNGGGIDVNTHPYMIDGTHAQNKENTEHDSYQHYERHGLRSAHEGRNSPYIGISLDKFLGDTEDTPSSKSSASRRQHRAKSANHEKRGSGTYGLVQRSTSFNHNHEKNNSVNRNGACLVYSEKGTHSHKIVRAGDCRHLHRHQGHVSPRSKKATSTSKLYYTGRKISYGNVYTSENSYKLSSKYQPSLEYSLGVSTDEELTTDTSHCLSAREQQHSQKHHHRSTNRPKSAFTKRGHSNTGRDTEPGSLDNNAIADFVGGSLTNQQLLQLSSLSAAQKDAILSDVIENGDRVSITVAQNPPRYGRKKPKPIIYTGIVKYKGLLDKDHYDARIYVGLRLDAPLGETDGAYKGKRYMFTPPEHAKFFKIRDLDSVLDVPSSMYIPISKLILFHKENNEQYNDHTGDSFISNNIRVPLHNGHHAPVHAAS